MRKGKSDRAKFFPRLSSFEPVQWNPLLTFEGEFVFKLDRVMTILSTSEYKRGMWFETISTMETSIIATDDVLGFRFIKLILAGSLCYL
jgi:hypothetical protein